MKLDDLSNGVVVGSFFLEHFLRWLPFSPFKAVSGDRALQLPPFSFVQRSEGIKKHLVTQRKALNDTSTIPNWSRGWLRCCPLVNRFVTFVPAPLATRGYYP